LKIDGIICKKKQQGSRKSQQFIWISKAELWWKRE